MTTANIATSKIIPDSTRITPYYNIWGENDNYMTILFRPGYAVQATELTQIQSILQNQIERFGNHIFKNGSKVLGGSITIDDRARHINLQTQYANTDISVGLFTGNVITHTTGNAYVQAYVVGAKSPTANDSPVIVVKYITGNEFEMGTTIKSEANTYATIASANAYGSATTVSISEGIFYINGYFVKVPEQTIIVDKFSTQANARIGLEYSYDIIDSSSDTNLLDPAQEASNYQAPGANRLQINFDLATRTLTSSDDETFVEFMRIENGIIKSETVYPQYSALGDTLARRTYDESGNYTVRPFLLNLIPHPTDDTSLQALLDPGKAYVQGYETESIAQLALTIPRARANSSVNNYDIPMNYGNYVIVSELRGIFDITTGAVADIHCVPYESVNAASNVAYTATKIGTAHVRAITYEGASNTSNANTRTYRLSLFDSSFGNLKSNVVTAGANGIVVYEAVNSSTFSAVTNAYVGGVLRIIPSTGGAAAEESLIISAYNGTTKQINTATSFVTTPNSAFQFSIDYDFSMAESFMISANTPGSPSARANANINVLSKSNGTSAGYATLSEPTLNSLVFPFPQKFIKPASITDQNFQYIKKMSVTFAANVATATLSSYPDETFNGGGGAGTSSAVLSNFIVIPDTAGAAPLQLSTVGISLGVATITSATAFSGSATAFVVVNMNSGTNAQQKTKTLVTANSTHYAGGTANGIFASLVATTSNVYLNAGQTVIFNPTRTPDVDMSLYVSDVKEIVKIYDLAGASIGANGSSMTGYSDVTSSYNFDTGQRDSHYDHASIRLKSRVAAPVGPLVVVYNWYEHTASGDGTGYFDVDSYPNVANTAGYVAVPNFTKADGTVLSLRDCIDFRPRRQNASNAYPNYTVQTFRVPMPNDNFQADYGYYLGRRDYIVMTPNQQSPFTLIQGESGLYPQWPRVMDNAMVLYKIYLEPYTLGTTNAIVTFVENKRYTMRDIGLLENRIENLEYYQTLSLLEKAVADLSILDSDGLERTKYGILVDNFASFAAGDVNNIDYNVSIDRNQGAALPRQVPVERKLYPASLSSTKTIGEKTLLNYTEEEMVSQTLASKWINVQPYLFADFIGTIMMDPPADNWIDTVQAPDVLINVGEVNSDLLANNATNQARANTRNNAFTTVPNLPQTRFGTILR